MRLDNNEKKALKFALQGFKGETFLFGSRINKTKNGGDIDILLIPKGTKSNPTKLALKIEASFFSMCEQRIDVIVYNNGLFCKEILKNAKRIDIERI
ncbi:MAG: nucleotidyltransferase domain-containing protein [bacterium]